MELWWLLWHYQSDPEIIVNEKKYVLSKDLDYFTVDVVQLFAGNKTKVPEELLERKVLSFTIKYNKLSINLM